mmetsp:Transcript_2462/g.3603  ORF Transcript_2462/g.3603 Transcript_2462/m.3603 type:complete len:246 (+) Transcript_2462:29-766(+)
MKLIFALIAQFCVICSYSFLFPFNGERSFTVLRKSAFVNTEISDSKSFESLDHLKTSFLKLTVSSNRGINSSEKQRETIMELIDKLEEINPNKEPNVGLKEGVSPLEGSWKLIYSNSPDILSLSLVPGILIGEIYQNIYGMREEIDNVVEIQSILAPFIPSTKAKFIVNVKGNVSTAKRINLSFDKQKFVPETFFGKEMAGVFNPIELDIPLPFRNVGWLDHTFVDEDLRIGRSFQNIFVLLKAD